MEVYQFINKVANAREAKEDCQMLYEMTIQSKCSKINHTHTHTHTHNLTLVMITDTDLQYCCPRRVRSGQEFHLRYVSQHQMPETTLHKRVFTENHCVSNLHIVPGQSTHCIRANTYCIRAIYILY